MNTTNSLDQAKVAGRSEAIGCSHRTPPLETGRDQEKAEEVVTNRICPAASKLATPRGSQPRYHPGNAIGLA